MWYCCRAHFRSHGLLGFIQFEYEIRRLKDKTDWWNAQWMQIIDSFFFWNFSIIWLLHFIPFSYVVVADENNENLNLEYLYDFFFAPFETLSFVQMKRKNRMNLHLKCVYHHKKNRFNQIKCILLIFSLLLHFSCRKIPQMR